MDVSQTTQFTTPVEGPYQLLDARQAEQHWWYRWFGAPVVAGYMRYYQNVTLKWTCLLPPVRLVCAADRGHAVGLRHRLVIAAFMTTYLSLATHYFAWDARINAAGAGGGRVQAAR